MDSTSIALWNALAFEIVHRLALSNRAFSTDAVWQALGDLPRPDDPRALGPILLRARKERLIVKSDLVVNSVRPECHARPVNIWLSVPLAGTINDAAAVVAAQKMNLRPPQFDFSATTPDVPLAPPDVRIR